MMNTGLTMKLLILPFIEYLGCAISYAVCFKQDSVASKQFYKKFIFTPFYRKGNRLIITKKLAKFMQQVDDGPVFGGER